MSKNVSTLQDKINNEVISNIIGDIEIELKEMSLESHHKRLNSLDNFIKFISGQDFIEYIRKQLKDNNAQD